MTELPVKDRVLPLLAAMLPAALGACGSGNEEDRVPPPAIVDANVLDAEAQQQRLAGCQLAAQGWKDRGIWQSGGARPRIDATDWNGLDENEREAILAIAACHGTAGQIGRAEVVIESATTGAPVHVETVLSNRAFAEPLPR